MQDARGWHDAVEQPQGPTIRSAGVGRRHQRRSRPSTTSRARPTCSRSAPPSRQPAPVKCLASRHRVEAALAEQTREATGEIRHITIIQAAAQDQSAPSRNLAPSAHRVSSAITAGRAGRGDANLPARAAAQETQWFHNITDARFDQTETACRASPPPGRCQATPVSVEVAKFLESVLAAWLNRAYQNARSAGISRQGAAVAHYRRPGHRPRHTQGRFRLSAPILTTKARNACASRHKCRF